VPVFCRFHHNVRDEGGTGIGREVYHFDVACGTPGQAGAQQGQQVLPGTGDRDVADVAVDRDEPPVQRLLVPGVPEPRLRVPLHPDQQGQDGSGDRQGGRFVRPVVQPHTRLSARRTHVVGGPGRSVVQDRRGRR